MITMKKSVLTAFITVVCATSSVMAADDNAITDGSVTFNGKVIAPAVMLPTYWFSVWWCFWGAPVASISIRCPSCSATEGVVRNGKSTAGHQRYLCSHCRKTWQLQFTYTASQPGTHQKIIDMAMNGVGCRASARIMGVGLNTVLRHLKNSGRSR